MIEIDMQGRVSLAIFIFLQQNKDKPIKSFLPIAGAKKPRPYSAILNILVEDLYKDER